MQDVLTTIATLTEIALFVSLVIVPVIHAWELSSLSVTNQPSQNQVSISTESPTQIELKQPDEIEQLFSNAFTGEELEIESSAIDQLFSESINPFSGLGVKKLRVICSEKGIKWRNANGMNQHLKREQMISAILAL